MFSTLIFAVVYTLACFQSVLCSENVTFDDYSLVSFIPKKIDHLHALRHFADPDDQVEVLRRSRDLNDPFDVLVPPNKVNFINDFSEIYGVEYQVKENDYSKRLIPETRRSSNGAFDIFNYNSFDAIDAFLENLQVTKSHLVKLQPLGKSYEGRRMKLIRISSNHSAENPAVFIDAGIHAREWAAPVMATYIINRLTHDRHAQEELEGLDWFILPVVNPDGYEYSRSHHTRRLWRKTRSPHGRCLGVDGNRNYGYKWGVIGVSSDPCDKSIYAGPRPFSEVETRMVRDVMKQYSNRIKLYVSLHAYGQYLVYPWGYTAKELPSEWRKLDDMAREVSAAVVRAGGKPFKVLSAGKWYAAAGGSDDYAYGGVGIPYSFTMELTDGYEFNFPQSKLRTVMPQFYEGFRAFACSIKGEFGNALRTKEKSKE